MNYLWAHPANTGPRHQSHILQRLTVSRVICCLYRMDQKSKSLRLPWLWHRELFKISVAPLADPTNPDLIWLPSSVLATDVNSDTSHYG